MSDTPETGPLTLDEAVERYTAAPEGTPAKPETKEAPRAEEIEAAEVEQDVEAETPEGEGEDRQILTVDEYGDVLVQVGDETLPLSEVTKGTLRRADYTRKTQEIAEARKAVEARERELAELERSLTLRQAQMFGDEEEPDWAAKFEEDPIGASIEKAQYEKRQKERAKARAEAEMISQRQVAEFRAMTAEKAREIFPEWGEDQKYVAHEPARRAIAREFGFTDQEYDSAVDFRMAALLEAVRVGRQPAETVEKKVSKTPRVLKPGASKTGKERNAERAAAIRQKMSRPHSMEQALAWQAELASLGG